MSELIKASDNESMFGGEPVKEENSFEDGIDAVELVEPVLSDPGGPCSPLMLGTEQDVVPSLTTGWPAALKSEPQDESKPCLSPPKVWLPETGVDVEEGPLEVETGEEPLPDLQLSAVSSGNSFEESMRVGEGKTMGSYSTSQRSGFVRPRAPVKRMFICTFCPYTSSSKRNLARHILTHAENSFEEGKKVGEGETMASCSTSQRSGFIHPIRTPTKKKFICTFCPYTSSYKRNLARHILTHSGNISEEGKKVEGETITSSSTSQRSSFIHPKALVKKTFICTFCPFTSSYKKNLARHVLTHTGEKLFECPECSFTCSQKGNLTSHIKTHSGNKPFKCPQCSFTYSRKSNLARHIRAHTGEKPFECPHCSFTCSRKSSLVCHIRTHTGEKPFECPYCNFTCSWKSHLTIHIRTHTGERPYKCPQCTFTCSQRSHLIPHIRTHTGETPFECPQCSFTCSQKSGLNRHIRTQTGEKPFECPHCSFTCCEKTYLAKHIRKRHSEEKP